MKNRIYVGLLCLGALLLGLSLRSLLPSAFAQSAMPNSPAQPGRYSAAANNYGIYFADTQTGRLWFYPNGLVVNEKGNAIKATWREMPTPAAQSVRRP